MAGSRGDIPALDGAIGKDHRQRATGGREIGSVVYGDGGSGCGANAATATAASAHGIADFDDLTGPHEYAGVDAGCETDHTGLVLLGVKQPSAEPICLAT